MKILFLVQKEQRIILDRLYEAISANSECDLHWLDSKQQSNLRKYFKESIDVNHYDRILLFLRIKKEMKQVSFLKTIPNLVFLEHDAYQNYIPCKYTNRYSNYYKKLPWVRVLSSGYTVSKKLREEGVDALFVPKGYDQQLLCNLQLERDIELGFLGSIKSSAYSERKAFLEQLAKDENLLFTRTNSGDEYLQTLNRIRFFVGCDMGMGEYMIKNFEAMACGCVLFTYNQGDEENRALGFKDMENVVLYSSIQEFKNKLKILRAHTELAEAIARNGQKFVESNYSFQQLGKLVVDALEPSLRQMPRLSRLQMIRNRLGI